MNRAKILFLAHRIPFPPDKGDKIRSYHWLEHLARRHDVYCACFIDDDADWPHVAALRERCREVIALPLTRTQKLGRAALGLLRSSLTESIYQDRAMTTALSELNARIEFDAVLAFSGAMAPYALDVRAARRVLDLCDCDSAKWNDYANRPGNRFVDALLRREAIRLRSAEQRWLTQFDAVTVIHERERRLLNSDRVSVIRNGVNIPPPSPIPAAPIVSFVGALDYAANVDGLTWFVNEIWPRVVKAVPQAEFRMIGRAPTATVQKLAAHARVTLIGQVTNVTPELEATRVCVVPLRIARGVQNKLLEAAAHGRPVVATSNAAAGVEAGTSRRMLIADDPASFAQAIIRCLSDLELCCQLGIAGRRRMAECFDWNTPCAEMESHLLSGKSGPRPRAIKSKNQLPLESTSLSRLS